MAGPVLEVEDLRTHFLSRTQVVRAVDGVSLHVDRGETVGLVGESGCGKTTLALSILRLLPKPARIVSGGVLVHGRDVLGMDAETLRRLRGGEVSMTLQDPMTALDPVMRIGAQVKEAMSAHDRFTAAESRRRVVPLLERGRGPGAAHRARDYPHQLSGGMRQRVLIAAGIANEPALLIADEATTALDTVTQSQMVRLLRQLNLELETAVVLITHNMGLVATMCHRVLVMYAGMIVEEGEVDRVFTRPQHPYTWHLLRSIARADVPRRRGVVVLDGQPPDPAELPHGCSFHPRCAFREDRCVRAEPALREAEAGHWGRCVVLGGEAAEQARAQMKAMERSSSADLPRSREHRSDAEPGTEVILRVEELHHRYRPGWFSGTSVKALDGVSLDVRTGETLGIIGESGCGKSTLAMAASRLLQVDSGHIFFEGREVTSLQGAPLRQLRRQLQVIFQDPFSSLDPRMSIGSTIREPLDNYGIGHRSERGRRVGELLEKVGVSSAWVERYPHELSGGQRQRVGIARALALTPRLLVCDEPMSALDVSIQAQILSLLRNLQEEFRLTYLFISHDLGVIRQIADRVAVMYLGRIVELAHAEDLFTKPQHPYTRALLDSVCVPDPVRAREAQVLALEQEMPTQDEMPSGCRFRDRCPNARSEGICATEVPALLERGGENRLSACHFAGDTDPYESEGAR